jgi:hypothetical protein
LSAPATAALQICDVAQDSKPYGHGQRLTLAPNGLMDQVDAKT